VADSVVPASGVSSDLEAAREVISKDRDSFSYVPAAAMSAKAAEVAVGELADEPVGESVDHEGVDSWLFEAVEVTVNDLTSVLVASGAMTLAELCTGDTAKRCARLGLV
jgi:ABC-type xylose transport system substrate-binding protein